MTVAKVHGRAPGSHQLTPQSSSADELQDTMTPPKEDTLMQLPLPLDQEGLQASLLTLTEKESMDQVM